MSVVTPSVVLCVGNSSKLTQVPKSPQKDGALQRESSQRHAVASRTPRASRAGTPVLTATLVPSDLGGYFLGSGFSCCDGDPSASSLWGQEVLERVTAGPAWDTD